MEFSVLGPLRVTSVSGEIPIRKGISRRLLVALLLRPGDPVNASALVDILWGDDLPQNPSNALQLQISYLRRTLSSGSSDASQPIVTRAGGYCLDIDADQVDLFRFERLVLSLSSKLPVLDHGAALEALAIAEEATGMWRGDVLADVVGEPFVEGTIARFDEMRWSCAETRVDVLLDLGRHREVVELTGDLLADQPLRERFHAQRMLALYRSGRQADALATYDRARSSLLDELGLDPGPELQKLQIAILAQDGCLDHEPLEAPPAPPVEPAARVPVAPSPLPFHTTPLIGRDLEVERLLELRTKHRIMTLTGPGGAGKTRLAVELLTGCGHREAVWFADLGPLDAPELVGQTVARIVGARVAPGQDAADAVAATLAGERGTLVLDTCEHLLAAAAHLASAVARRAPEVRILSTSRRALGIAGEFAWPVSPLTIANPDATTPAELAGVSSVELFCDRAQAVRPDFVLDPTNAADVAAICTALDGIPLAIELAAARVDVLEPSMIRTRLEDRFDLLTSGAVDVAERQQTLRAAIGWSIELLGDEEQCFFARLGAFAGGFDLDGARVVAAHELQTDVLELVTSLVRHSTLIRVGPDRYRLLDTLRAYAVELLADLDADATRRRHAEHHVELAERLELAIRRPGQDEALQQLRSNVPNFLSAADWSIAVGDLDLAIRLAGALAWFWTLDGHLATAHQHLRHASAIDDAAPAARTKVLWGYALLLTSLGELDEAIDASQASVAIARQIDDPAAVGAGLNALAVARWAAGDIDGSKTLHDEAIDLFVDVGDAWGEAVCRTLRARTALDLGDDDADRLLGDAAAAAERAGDSHVVALVLGLAAQRHEQLGDLDHAREDAAESLRLHESIEYSEGALSAMHLLARLDLREGRNDSAADLFRQSLVLGRRLQHSAAVCEAIEGLAVVVNRRGDHRWAARALRAAARERDARRLPVRAADAELLVELGDLDLTAPIFPAPTLADVMAAALETDG